MQPGLNDTITNHYENLDDWDFNDKQLTFIEAFLKADQYHLYITLQNPNKKLAENFSKNE